MSRIIQLISGPRNISTALMYAFANRPDTSVVDEPYYAYYLIKTGKDHPGRGEVLETMSADIAEIDQDLLERNGTPFLFLKNMAHHLVDFVPDFTPEVRNIFLIRNPKQLIASLAQVIPNPDMQDIALKRQYEIFQGLKDDAVVVDSNEILADPEVMLPKLCEAVGMPFDDHMLSWEPGPIQEDGCWAKYWYKNVHRTSGWEKQPTSSRELPEELIGLYEEAQPYYDSLYAHAIK